MAGQGGFTMRCRMGEVDESFTQPLAGACVGIVAGERLGKNMDCWGSYSVDVDTVVVRL